MNQTQNDREPKPMFNVNPGFLGTFVISFDELMVERFEGFLKTNDHLIGDDEEIRDFANALQSKRGQRINPEGPSFVVEGPTEAPLDGAYVIRFSEEMCFLLSDYIKDVSQELRGVDPIIWAFSKALEYPRGKTPKQFHESAHFGGDRYHQRGDHYSDRSGRNQGRYEGRRNRY